jgi:hypothetical protein
MAKFKRKRLFVDRSVQGAFMLRAAGHWLLCVTMLTVVYTAVSLLVEPLRLFFPDTSGLWFCLAPAVVTTLLLLPIIVYDTVKLTHRFVGPMLRLRRGMRELAAGVHVEAIRFRDDDFWKEFADEFNALADRVQRGTPAAELTTAEALGSQL